MQRIQIGLPTSDLVLKCLSFDQLQHVTDLFVVFALGVAIYWSVKLNKVSSGIP